MELRGTKVYYEPSIAPNENYPLRNGTWGLYFNQPAPFDKNEVDAASNQQTGTNGVWCPWKPFSFYFNVARHLRKHAHTPMLTYAYDATKLTFTNVSNTVGTVLTTDNIIIGPTASNPAGEIIGKLKVTYYIRLK